MLFSRGFIYYFLGGGGTSLCWGGGGGKFPLINSNTAHNTSTLSALTIDLQIMLQTKTLSLCLGILAPRGLNLDRRWVSVVRNLRASPSVRRLCIARQAKGCWGNGRHSTATTPHSLPSWGHWKSSNVKTLPITWWPQKWREKELLFDLDFQWIKQLHMYQSRLHLSQFCFFFLSFVLSFFVSRLSLVIVVI